MGIQLSAPQALFLNCDNKFKAYVGGFGSGKTFSGCLDIATFLLRNPGTRAGYFAPTYRDVRDVFYPTFEEACGLLGLNVDVKTGNHEVDVYRGRSYLGTTICRSMEIPAGIVGFKIAMAVVDEIDVMSMDKAELAWRKIIARMRLVIPGVTNHISVTTTPEGFKFTYRQFADNPSPSYSMVQASTYENARFLPPDYISSLRETYPSQLIEAYLNGEFVNLTSGSVYYAYDRVAHRSREAIQPGEPLFIGQDFNVNHMASTVYVQRGEAFHAVDEMVDLRDTPDVVRAIQERYEGHYVIMYPDASGANTKSTNASLSDIGILEQAGFEIRANPSNPRVKDRIAAVNAALEHGKMFVNDARCPTTAKCLEQQVYDERGEPDKKSGVDHQNDATGYPIVYELPIVKPVISMPVTFAL